MLKKKTKPRIVFESFNYAFFILMIGACILPIWHVVCASFSDAAWVMGQAGIIYYIKGFNVEGYKLVFENSKIWSGYLNTIVYVIATTSIGMFITLMMAYMVSRKNLLWANTIMLLVSFTMLFNGGLISSYIINTKVLNLYDSRWAIILPGCINAFYLILIRTAMTSIPRELEESAKLDGAGHMTVLFRIILPLIKATLATVILYYVIMQWNSWFPASIYIRSVNKFPLQLVLKEILITGDTSTSVNSLSATTGDAAMYKQLIKYCTIVVSTVPIFIFYPFIQKYFESGVMIGAVKG